MSPGVKDKSWHTLDNETLNIISIFGLVISYFFWTVVLSTHNQMKTENKIVDIENSIESNSTIISHPNSASEEEKSRRLDKRSASLPTVVFNKISETDETPHPKYNEIIFPFNF